MTRGASHARLVPPETSGGTPLPQRGEIPCLCCRNPFRSPDKKRIRLCAACKKRGGALSVFDAPGGNGCGRVVMGGR